MKPNELTTQTSSSKDRRHAMTNFVRLGAAAFLVGLLASVASANGEVTGSATLSVPRVAALKSVNHAILLQAQSEERNVVGERPGAPRWKGERPAPNQKPIMQWFVVCIVIGLILFIVCLPSRRPYGD